MKWFHIWPKSLLGKVKKLEGVNFLEHLFNKKCSSISSGSNQIELGPQVKKIEVNVLRVEAVQGVSH